MEGLILPTDIWLWILGVAVGLAGWEWRKQMTLKAQVDKLEEKMQQLHKDHQNLLMQQDGNHVEVLRGITTALRDLHTGIHELTHYIRWLGSQQTGTEPPPPLLHGHKERPK